jgi:hypothetical protein
VLGLGSLPVPLPDLQKVAGLDSADIHANGCPLSGISSLSVIEHPLLSDGVTVQMTDSFACVNGDIAKWKHQYGSAHRGR